MTAPPADRFDVVTMGRIGVDIYPLQAGVSLSDVETFGKFLGGSPTNVAVAAARLGRRTAVVTRTGQDPFGDYCHRALTDFGVDDRWVTPVPGLATPVTFCEIFPPDHFPLYFYRQSAPDLRIVAGELDLAGVRDARVFWATGTGLCEEPSREATLAALAARGGGADSRGGADRDPGTVATVLDLDWRPVFWPDGPQAARPIYRAALAHATVAVGNLDECEVATGVRDPAACADALLDGGAELAVVKLGGDGVLAAHRGGTRVQVPPHPVEVLNGLGAGDAFGGALCHGLLAGWDLEHTVRRANAAGALVASRLACSTAMPTDAELDDFLGAPDGNPPARTPTG
ncbi:5-dehydro-2-deoxygluconokinase [Streptomyces sp. RKND-216]|uniref:5-dehydro-2-deoxygluconokinase n=1 Tax=Streptomyces sp. RKND-216 TaxID=2562581 RepID=UPI00109DFEB0|nr:5-dehydro-2-deoxygluconokinase [Streptomyces sp. RKND-216]THA26307.1 5-dehydro-2-deoxygluconokinase [Streptomyces sp. RKND-216]